MYDFVCFMIKIFRSAQLLELPNRPGTKGVSLLQCDIDCNDAQQNDNNNNDSEHNDSEHNDSEHNDSEHKWR